MYEEEYFNAVESNIEKGIEVGYASTYYLISPAFLLWQSSLIEIASIKQKKQEFFEIGVATGNLLDVLRELQPGLSLKGIDISKYAVKISLAKGHDVKQSSIEKYKTTKKASIIFSAETMEHLENLKTFLEGVKRNLRPDGLFLFYVPSISETDAIKQSDDYLRFNLNLEHLLHFSPEFLEKQLPMFFDADVLIKEFKTSYGPSILGAVSKDRRRLGYLKKLFALLETGRVPDKESSLFIKNAAIIALKFGYTELADKLMTRLQKSNYEPRETELIRGLKSYHLGHLEKANQNFQNYLKLSPGSLLATQLLLSNERELNNIYKDNISEYARRLEALSELNSQKTTIIEKMKRQFRK